MDPAPPSLMALTERAGPPPSSLLLPEGSTNAFLQRCGAAIDPGTRSWLTPVGPFRDTPAGLTSLLMPSRRVSAAIRWGATRVARYAQESAEERRGQVTLRQVESIGNTSPLRRRSLRGRLRPPDIIGQTRTLTASGTPQEPDATAIKHEKRRDSVLREWVKSCSDQIPASIFGFQSG